MVISVVMYGSESWIIKKAEYWRSDAFKLWYWRRLLWVSWTTKRSNHSVRKEINPECSLEGRILKRKLQRFGHLMWRANSLEKTLMLEKMEGRRRRGLQRMRYLDRITHSMGMSLSKLREMVKDRDTCHAAVHGVTETDPNCRLNTITSLGFPVHVSFVNVYHKHARWWLQAIQELSARTESSEARM